MKRGGLLGIDIGTSSSKGVLVDDDGRVLASAVRPHCVSLPQAGWAEHDPDTVWWRDFCSISRSLVGETHLSPGCVAVSGIGPCLLPGDADGAALRPAILYGVDTRATAEIAELAERYGSSRILDRCGSVLSSQAVGPKLLWLRGNEPDVWARTRKLFTAQSHVVYRLTGAYVIDHHSASQCTPLYDVHARDWIENWVGDLCDGVELPELVWPSDVVGTVTSDAAEETGLSAGTPVIAGTIDAWAEAFSIGVERPGDLMLMYGTTMFLVLVVDTVRPDELLWTTAGTFPGTTTVAAGMSTSGALTSWLRELTGRPPHESLLEEAALAGPGAGGLIVLPYFAGERTPLYDPAARGCVFGLTLRHGRGHLYRAALEATAFGVRHILETIAEAGHPVERASIAGGGTRGRLWPAIVSDVTGRPQEVPKQLIGACYGDAALAFIALHGHSPIGDWNPVSEVIEPDPSTRELYDALYSLYRELYPETREQIHALASLQTKLEGAFSAAP